LRRGRDVYSFGSTEYYKGNGLHQKKQNGGRGEGHVEGFGELGDTEKIGKFWRNKTLPKINEFQHFFLNS
jgi:hypothetical protein